MSLNHSAWKKVQPEAKFSDYILILPEHQVIVNFTSKQDEDDRRFVWGCWIHEKPGSVVYTALRNAKEWRRESYELSGNELHWHNKGGSSSWIRIQELDIPEELRVRGEKWLQQFSRYSPPQTPEGPAESEPG